jgi:hypothetical protein
MLGLTAINMKKTCEIAKVWKPSQLGEGFTLTEVLTVSTAAVTIHLRQAYVL